MNSSGPARRLTNVGATNVIRLREARRQLTTGSLAVFKADQS